MAFHFFPCLHCATETRRSRFCELGLVSSRKELGELSISLCILLSCPSKFVRLWTMAQNESYFWLVMMAYGVFVFFTDWVFTYMVVDIVLN